MTQALFDKLVQLDDRAARCDQQSSEGAALDAHWKAISAPWSNIDDYAKWTNIPWTNIPWTNTTGKGLFGDVAICALGLAGETGETVEVIKKAMRDGTLDHEELVKELGDVIYCWARLCDLFEIRPGMVLKRNVEKLMSRLERGVINGVGGDR